MGEYFISQDAVHSYTTRFSSKGAFAIPKVKSNGSKSFSFLGCNLWNKLPSDITKCNTLPAFKLAVKQYFLNSLH